MSETGEREDLESLLSNPGWLRLMAYARKTYAGDSYAKRIKAAIASAIAAKADVNAAVQAVDAESNAVNDVLSWPGERAKQLLALEDQRQRELQPQLSRRGNL